MKALDLELDRCTEAQGAQRVHPDFAEFSAYTDMLRNMFEAQRTAADRWVDAGQLRKRVAERQIKQLESLDKLNYGK